MGETCALLSVHTWGLKMFAKFVYEEYVVQLTACAQRAAASTVTGRQLFTRDNRRWRRLCFCDFGSTLATCRWLILATNVC